MFLSHVLIEAGLPSACKVTEVTFKLLGTMTLDVVGLQA